MEARGGKKGGQERRWIKRREGEGKLNEGRKGRRGGIRKVREHWKRGEWAEFLH